MVQAIMWKLNKPLMFGSQANAKRGLSSTTVLLELLRRAGLFIILVLLMLLIVCVPTAFITWASTFIVPNEYWPVVGSVAFAGIVLPIVMRWFIRMTYEVEQESLSLRIQELKEDSTFQRHRGVMHARLNEIISDDKDA